MRASDQESIEVEESNPNCHIVAAESPNIFISNLQEDDDDVELTPRDEDGDADEQTIGADAMQGREPSRLDRFIDSMDQN